MNDEYLWNKTGSDPQIEELERVLAVFRYRDDMPPATATQNVNFLERPRRFRISFAFAFASFAAVAILAGVWLLRSHKDPNSHGAQEVVFVQSTDAPDIGPIAEPTAAPPRNFDSQDRPALRRRPVAATSAALHRRSKVKDLAPKDTIAALTAEERFAYRQLMLALSITSSKLKIVQDTIDGTRAEDEASKNQR